MSMIVSAFGLRLFREHDSASNCSETHEHDSWSIWSETLDSASI